ncbi:MAG: hypothetical protein SOW59_07735, partial [Corynebacterium sp.]|nr:hypothetical protein [Corynebacterium sp.]
KGVGMARHSTGENNFRVAGWVVGVALIVSLALGALIILQVLGNSDTVAQEAPEASTTSAPPASTTTAQEAAAENASQEASPSTTVQVVSSSDSAGLDALAAATLAKDTLYLLDTSDGLAPFYLPVAPEIAANSHSVSAAGHQVALWNYSSPLSPGVVVGYRDNVNFGPSDDVAWAVQQFGTGGVPQTRSAIIAALNHASQHPSDARVLLITTGTMGDMDDATFRTELQRAKSDNVELAVVQLGTDGVDPEVRSIADSFVTVENPADAESMATALAAVSGVQRP